MVMTESTVTANGFILADFHSFSNSVLIMTSRERLSCCQFPDNKIPVRYKTKVKYFAGGHKVTKRWSQD